MSGLIKAFETSRWTRSVSKNTTSQSTWAQQSHAVVWGVRSLMSNQISKLLDPSATKHTGLGFVLLETISILIWPSFGTCYFLVVYGMLFILIPNKLFPSEEAKGRRKALRKKSSTSGLRELGDTSLRFFLGSSCRVFCSPKWQLNCHLKASSCYRANPS